MLDTLTRHWWVLAVYGAVAVIIGAYALVHGIFAVIAGLRAAGHARN